MNAPRHLEPLHRARTRTLDVARCEAGLRDGDAVLRLHGYPSDIHN